MEDDEEDEEAPFEEELSHEKLAAPPGLEWTITPEMKKNAIMMEVNTVTNEKGEDLWITMDSGAAENVDGPAVQGEATHWQSERSTVRCRKREHDAEQGRESDDRGGTPLRLDDAGNRRPEAADECGSDLRCWTQGDVHQGWRHHRARGDQTENEIPEGGQRLPLEGRRC